MKLQELLQVLSEDTAAVVYDQTGTPVEPEDLSRFLLCDVTSIAAIKTFDTQDGQTIPLVEITVQLLNI